MTKALNWMCSCVSLSLLLFVASCSKDSSQTATLQVRLTDAPGDYQEVNIDIDSVKVSSSNTSGSNSSWVGLDVKKGVYNLLDLTNGLDTLLGTTVLPAGKITQLRLVLGSNNTVKVAGQSYPLSTPSAQQSGLKILINTTLSAGVTYKITLDFDAARSIVVTGNSNYILKPVIRSVVEAQIGSIQGTVTPAAATPAVYAIHGSDTVASTFADDSGKFFLRGLAAGTYNVGFAPKTGYDPTSVSNVTVTVGNVTAIGPVAIPVHQ